MNNPVDQPKVSELRARLTEFAARAYDDTLAGKRPSLNPFEAIADAYIAAPTSERVQALEEAKGIDPAVVEACAKHADGCYADARLAAAIRALKAAP